MMGIGDAPVVLYARVAQALGIRDGDRVKFELKNFPEPSYEFKVHVKDSIQADFIIHGAISKPLSMLQSFSTSGLSTSEVRFQNGATLSMPHQNIWAGMKIFSLEGSVILYFDGASRNNPEGPSGYGYTVVTSDENSKDLVRGYGYRKEGGSSNEMEYAGLLEGLTWALRLDVKFLTIRGDSELVINQLTGTYRVESATLKPYHSKIKSMLKEAREAGTEITLEHIPRGANLVADSLANLGIDLEENATVCHWVNVNQLTERHM